MSNKIYLALSWRYKRLYSLIHNDIFPYSSDSHQTKYTIKFQSIKMYLWVFFFINSFQYKLCKVKRVQTGPKGIPFLVTHDGRTIRYPDPIIKVNDTIQLEIATSKILDFIKFDSGNLCMITGGRNLGRVGTVVNRERHPGSFDIVHIKDAQGHTFATRWVFEGFL